MAGYIHDQALTRAIRRLYAIGGNRNTGKAMKGGEEAGGALMSFGGRMAEPKQKPVKTPEQKQFDSDVDFIKGNSAGSEVYSPSFQASLDSKSNDPEPSDVEYIKGNYIPTVDRANELSNAVVQASRNGNVNQGAAGAQIGGTFSSPKVAEQSNMNVDNKADDMNTSMNLIRHGATISGGLQPMPVGMGGSRRNW